jgi:DNA mismatch endonuclease, patch repair protein
MAETESATRSEFVFCSKPCYHALGDASSAQKEDSRRNDGLVEVLPVQDNRRPMDIVDKETRSRMMGGIRGKDTKPEMAVRRLAHRMGYRFRLHRRDLAGSPDLVFPGRRKVIFVHGCYWHRHDGCRFAYSPKSNQEFWTRKFDLNVLRDRRVEQELVQLGWKVLTIWECEIADNEHLRANLAEFLSEC